MITSRHCIYSLRKQIAEARSQDLANQTSLKELRDRKAQELGFVDWKALVHDYKTPRPKTSRFAVLARNFSKHLITGKETASKLGIAAFGCQSEDRLRKICLIKGNMDALILFVDIESQKIRWKATFQSFVNVEFETLGRHPSGKKYRPETTLNRESDNKGYWKNFYHVSNLEEIDPIEVHQLWDFDCKRQYSPKYAETRFAIHRIGIKGIEHLLD